LSADEVFFGPSLSAVCSVQLFNLDQWMLRAEQLIDISLDLLDRICDLINIMFAAKQQLMW
jgi:hypothetical protein